MLLAAAAELDVDLTRSVMVGDRKSDVEAGRAAGCRTVFIDLDYTRAASVERGRDRAIDRGGGRRDSATTMEKGAVHMTEVADLKVKIFADGADLDRASWRWRRTRCIKGFTTNPTLMRKAGDHRLRDVSPASCSPPFPTGRCRSRCSPTTSTRWIAQAREIASWGKNVNVKIPVTNTKGAFAGPLIQTLVERRRDASTSPRS